MDGRFLPGATAREADAAAASNGFLDLGLLALQRGLNGRLQVVHLGFLRIGFVVHRPHIDELTVPAEDEELGREDRTIGFGRLLLVIAEVSKLELLLLRSLL